MYGRSSKDWCQNCGVFLAPSSERRGRMAAVPPTTGSWSRMISIREASFHIEGPKLFNSMPKVVRDCSTFDEMKVMLDLFLATLPDQPKLPGSTPGATRQDGHPSYSARDWARSLPGTLDWNLTGPLPLTWIQRKMMSLPGSDSLGASPPVSPSTNGGLPNLDDGILDPWN